MSAPRAGRMGPLDDSTRGAGAGGGGGSAGEPGGAGATAGGGAASPVGQPDIALPLPSLGGVTPAPGSSGHLARDFSIGTPPLTPAGTRLDGRPLPGSQEHLSLGAPAAPSPLSGGASGSSAPVTTSGIIGLRSAGLGGGAGPVPPGPASPPFPPVTVVTAAGAAGHSGSGVGLGSPALGGARGPHHEFSGSGSNLAPLGLAPRRVDTDDELLQQQVLWEVDLSELDFTGSKVLGRGAYGEVIQAKWRSLPVAIKRVNVASKGAWKELRHEIAVIAQLHHPRVVQFLGACTRSQPWLIISEYMPGRALSTLLESRNGRPLPYHVAGRFALDCAQGLRYLHEHKPLEIVHRDLKPNNLLIDGSGHVKIADFGLAKVLDVLKAQNDTYVMTGETGSYRYMAPEVFRHEKYSDKVDIYSVGMIAFQLFHGEVPFEGMPPLEAAKAAALKHLRPVLSAKLAPELRRLISACWHPDPSARPSAREVCTVLEALFPQDDPPPEVLTDERCCSVQ